MDGRFKSVRWHVRFLAGVGGLSVAMALVLAASPSVASKVSISFAENEIKSSLQVGALQAFHFYVVASEISGGLRGYQFEVDVPDGITVTGREARPGTAINIGTEDDWLVGMGTCDTGYTVVLVDYTAMLLAPAENLRIGLLPSIAGQNMGPSFLDCSGNSEIHDFDDIGAAAINAGQKSFGGVKSEFVDQ